MGMDAKKLSARLKQPGHDQTYRKSEGEFVRALEAIFPADEYVIKDHPSDLESMLSGRFGIKPEASLTYKPTGRTMYFEVKKQGPNGNADERACKHHTVQFYKSLAEFTGYSYHAFVTIMCENLATDDRYVIKHPYYYEPDHYYLWSDYTDLEDLGLFLVGLSQKFLEGEEPSKRVVPE